jgi:hypothetical protein
MGILNDASSPIVFAYWDRRPKTRHNEASRNAQLSIRTNYILVSSAQLAK